MCHQLFCVNDTIDAECMCMVGGKQNVNKNCMFECCTVFELNENRLQSEMYILCNQTIFIGHRRGQISYRYNRFTQIGTAIVRNKSSSQLRHRVTKNGIQLLFWQRIRQLVKFYVLMSSWM